MSVIEELDALQRQDSAIRELAQKARDLPLRRRQETDRVGGVELRLQEARSGVAAGEKSILSIEDDLATRRAVVDRYEKQRQTLRSAEEYKTMNAQIDRETRAIKEDEQRLANARQMVEDAKAGVASMEELLEEEKISEECLAIVKDIDKVSEKLKELQDKGISVIWRPLHEASNGYFWWGKTAASYKWLWSLLYQRQTNYHKLNNLIWVWSAQNAG